MSTSPTPKGQPSSGSDRTQTPEHQLNNQTFDYPGFFLRLDANRLTQTVFEHQTNPLGVSDNETGNTTSIDDEICLLNLRHIARHHGFNLQKIHPDASPTNEKTTTSPDEASISSNTPEN
jgi:hypothetical protein